MDKYTVEKVNKMLCDFDEDEDFIITTFQVKDSRIPRIPCMGFDICLKSKGFIIPFFHCMINNECRNKQEVCDFLNGKGQLYLITTCVV